MNLDSAGQFRCEISAEAPLFNTVSQSRPLSVIGKSSYVFDATIIQKDIIYIYIYIVCMTVQILIL